MANPVYVPFQMPLVPQQSQKFTTTLNGTVYSMTVRWNGQAGEGTWVLDISDSNEVSLIQGIPLVTGADLLEQYAYLDFGFALIVQSESGTDDVPTYDNLGTDGHLYALVPTAS